MFISTSTARADDAAKASALAERAAARAKAGDRRAAIDLYEEARAADPRRSFACEIAEQYDALAVSGDRRDAQLAELHYERCLRTEEPAARAEIEQRVARLRERRAKVGAAPPEAAAVPAVPLVRVPIRLLPYRSGEVYEVTLGTATCTTPCTILAPPGPANLRASGAGEVRAEVMIPAQPGQIQLQYRSEPTIAGGAILVSLGGLAAAGGWALKSTCGISEKCETIHEIAWPVIGTSMLIAGIVLLVYGHVPEKANRVVLGAPAEASRPRLTFAGVAPLPGGAGAGMELVF